MYRISFSVVQVVVCLSLVSVPAFSQNDESPDPTTDEQEVVGEILDSIPDTGDATPLPLQPSPKQRKLMDSSTVAEYKRAMSAYYQYRVFGYEHRKNVFAWQSFSTKVTFWVVLMLVFSGIIFSGIQFYKSIKQGFAEGGDLQGGSGTELELSTSGIKVTSPVLGVIILVISLAFFYLYLIHVYPIREIF